MAEEKKNKRHTTAHTTTQTETSKNEPKETREAKEIRITLPAIKGINLSTVATVAALILLLIVVFQAFQAFDLSQKISSLVADVKERAKLPAIEVTSIEANCQECQPLQGALSTIQAAAVNITKSLTLTAADPNSRQLIERYGVKRLPSIIITGEIGKVNLAGFTKAGTNDALIYAETPPPYVDAATGTVKGLVSLTYVNASGCAECSDLMPFVRQLRSAVKVIELKIVEKDSLEGKGIVEKYEMARLPGVLISSDINEYPIAQQLRQAGTAKRGGFIALGAVPPYLNMSTGKVAGITSLIMLNDTSCAGCYDVTLHIQVLEKQFGLYLKRVSIVDAGSSEGKALISKYKITAAPTAIIHGDASAYQQLMSVWPQVGSIESDGTLIFRKMSAIAGMPYKDLTTGQVMPNAPQQNQ